MCAIFGAANYDVFNELYAKNLDRGDFAFGGIFYYHHTPNTIERPRTSRLPLLLKQSGIYRSTPADHSQYDYYLGHSQAPTSAAQTFSAYTAHPFVHNTWAVAHNGVLTNHLKLKKQTKSPTNIVDSSVIPALLSDIENEGENLTGEAIVARMCEMLEGTYTLWIHNTAYGISYITRCGSTLFADFSNNTFSSTKVSDAMEEIQDGTILKIDNTGKLTVAATFKPNSPFFIL